MERAKPVSPEEWGKRVARWRDSGLSARQFAQELGINHHSLTTWATRLKQGYDRKQEAAQARERRSRRKTQPAASLTLVEVTGLPEPSPSSFELVVGGRVVRVPAQFDSKALLRLLAVLEGGQ